MKEGFYELGNIRSTDVPHLWSALCAVSANLESGMAAHKRLVWSVRRRWDREQIHSQRMISIVSTAVKKESRLHASNHIKEDHFTES